jgi:hypothetical protein
VSCSSRRGPHRLPFLGQGTPKPRFLHLTTIPKLVLDGVGVVWASLLKELLKVVCGRSHLMLTAARGSRGVHHAGAACLLVVVDVIADRGCDLLKMLLVPLLATLCTLPGVLYNDVRRCFPAAAWCQMKLGCLVVGGVLGAG